MAAAANEGPGLLYEKECGEECDGGEVEENPGAADRERDVSEAEPHCISPDAEWRPIDESKHMRRRRVFPVRGIRPNRGVNKK